MFLVNDSPPNESYYQYIIRERHYTLYFNSLRSGTNHALYAKSGEFVIIRSPHTNEVSGVRIYIKPGISYKVDNVLWYGLVGYRFILDVPSSS